MSVLFADLVGFTARSGSLDPEDVEAILRPFYDRLRTELEVRGGTVEKFIGDAVMAVFGAPITHEDDPERAVRAALAIRDWVREEEELEVRIAVNTGEVLVALEPSPGAERGLVAGDVVNTASRLQSAAPVNGILVEETTYNATSRVIEYREAPPVDAKGKTEPVLVWEAVQARSRFGTDITRRPSTPLVGRERELALLTSTLARVEHESSPQLITLVGVPGIGKSRLVHELFVKVDERPELIFWRQGRCLPYGDGVAFWALGEILKSHAGILEGEREERAESKLRSAVDDVVPEAAEAAWVTRELQPLLGLSDGADAGASEDRRVESFAAWRRFFEGLAEQRLLIIVLEDLHWADEGLLDFVDHLVDWATGIPILVVATARPELLTRRPGWSGGKPNAATISLSPLTGHETSTLLHGLLEQTVLPADVQSLLLDRAGGNPLYAEEFARIALERDALGGGELPLPESVQGLISARLDTLTDEEKALVQDASVVGKVFWLGALAQLSAGVERSRVEELLRGLQRKQFVRRERRSSMEGDDQYSFEHTLVRDVAYAQIPRADRAEKHRRAAAWIESLGRPDDLAELRAHHYVSAIEALPAAGDDEDLRRSARLALRDAGDRAFSLNAFAAALHEYHRALELWPEDDPDRPRLLLATAVARNETDVVNQEELAAARDALLAAGDREGAADAELRRAETFWNLGRGDDVLQSLERTVELAEDLPVSRVKAGVYAGIFRLHWLANREELASRFGNEAMQMVEELSLDEVRAQLLNTFGSWRAMEGDKRGLDQIAESIDIFERLKSAAAQRSYNNLADLYYNLGDLQQSAEVTKRMMHAWKRFSHFDWLRWGDSQEIRLHYMAGRWDDAAAIADRWIADSESRQAHYLEPLWRWLRGKIVLERGDTASALAESAAALEVARTAGDSQLVTPTLAFRCRVLWEAEQGGAEAAAVELAELGRSAPLHIAHDWFPEVAVALADLDLRTELEAIADSVPTATPWRDAGLALGRGDAPAAAAIFSQMGARPLEAEAHLLAAKDGLRADLPAAIEFFREVGAVHWLREAEPLLARSRSA
ncbi:MAG: ATP-binding protein [Gaiellaceae bacterium]